MKQAVDWATPATPSAGTATSPRIFSGSKVIAEYVNGAAVGSPTREYIYSGSALVATIEGSTTTYHHQDHLSVRACPERSRRVNTNTAGTVVGPSTPGTPTGTHNIIVTGSSGSLQHSSTVTLVVQ